jgi:hypothetical protein
MFVTVKMISEEGEPDEFVYEAFLDEQNEDTGDYVWSDLGDEGIIVEMMDRATEQVRCLFPNHKILEAAFTW